LYLLPTNVSVAAGRVNVLASTVVERCQSIRNRNFSGVVKVLFVKVSVEDVVTTFTPSTAILPAAALVIVVSDALISMPPCSRVVVIELLPRIAVLEPKPTAS
jgi:hypothetical protein